MGTIRKKYTAEFKEEAVNLVTEQEYPISETARNLGINADMLAGGKGRLWVRPKDLRATEARRPCSLN